MTNIIPKQQLVEKKSIAPVIRSMDVNQQEIYPLSRMMSVKATVTVLKHQTGMELSTEVDPETQTITVTRKA